MPSVIASSTMFLAMFVAKLPLAKGLNITLLTASIGAP